MSVSKSGFRIPGMTVAILFFAGCVVSPHIIEEEELLELLAKDEQLLRQSRVPLDGPLSLGEIMARAVKTNLDQKVSDLEETLAFGTLELSHYDLLPSAVASRAYYDRSNDSASRSISVQTRQESLEPSTSQERQHIVDEMRVSWNVLDYGVSYFQAKQEANRYLIASVYREKALIDLIQQARGAYWRALASQRMAQPVADTIADTIAAYEEISEGIEERIYPDLVGALQTKKELFNLVGQLQQLQSDLEQSTILLANFINVPFGSELVIEDPGTLPELNVITADIDAMEFTALMNSSEVMEQAYNTRIDHDETRKAMLSMLPGLELGYTFNNDDNQFLFNQDWNEATARLSWDLLNLVSARQVVKNADIRERLQDQRRLAANVAVITRLNLALHQYNNQLNQLYRAKEVQSINEQIASLTDNAVASRSVGMVNLIRSQVESLSTNLSYYQSYAESQEAYGTILVSLGLSPLPAAYQDWEIDELGNVLEDISEDWVAGNFPLMDPPVKVGSHSSVETGAQFVAYIQDNASPNNFIEQLKQHAAVNKDQSAAEADLIPVASVVAILEEWLEDWERRDSERYLAHYHEDFISHNGMGYSAWARQRRERLSNSESIELSHREIEITEREGDWIKLTFSLHYSSQSYEDRSRKEMVFFNTPEGWRIISEKLLDLDVIRA